MTETLTDEQTEQLARMMLAGMWEGDAINRVCQNVVAMHVPDDYEENWPSKVAFSFAKLIAEAMTRAHSLGVEHGSADF